MLADIAQNQALLFLRKCSNSYNRFNCITNFNISKKKLRPVFPLGGHRLDSSVVENGLSVQFFQNLLGSVDGGINVFIGVGS
jgi:hypothetical protein